MKNKYLITLILCITLGWFGVHRFYNGKIGTGILMFLTLGGCGIIVISDFISIIKGTFTDINGNKLK